MASNPLPILCRRATVLGLLLAPGMGLGCVDLAERETVASVPRPATAPPSLSPDLDLVDAAQRCIDHTSVCSTEAISGCVAGLWCSPTRSDYRQWRASVYDCDTSSFTGNNNGDKTTAVATGIATNYVGRCEDFETRCAGELAAYRWPSDQCVDTVSDEEAKRRAGCFEGASCDDAMRCLTDSLAPYAPLVAETCRPDPDDARLAVDIVCLSESTYVFAPTQPDTFFTVFPGDTTTTGLDILQDGRVVADSLIREFSVEVTPLDELDAISFNPASRSLTIGLPSGAAVARGRLTLQANVHVEQDSICTAQLRQTIDYTVVAVQRP